MAHRPADDRRLQAARLDAHGDRGTAALIGRLAAGVVVVLGIASPAVAGLDPALRARLLASRQVAAGVVDALEARARVRVVVAFTAPADGDGRGAAEERRRRIARTGDAIVAAAGARHFRLRRRFGAVHALAGDVTATGLARLLEQPAVRRVDEDAPGRAALAEALPIVNLDDVKAGGSTGAGVTVAVIDTGVDRDHPDLADALVGEACFCSGGGGCCPDGSATQIGAGAAEDDQGHGTNVSGIVTSNGTAAPAGGAPAAALVAVKVLDAAGAFCCTSDVVAGMDWVLQNHPETRIVNLSLGTNALFAGACDTATAFTIAFADAVAALRANGTLTVVSSGNQASSTAMAAPACIADAVAVGATWDAAFPAQTLFGCTDTTVVADRPACFANSNAATDLFAPGAWIASAGIGGGISIFAGTSQAAPMVAACAADLLQAAGPLAPAELEAALAATPVSVVDPKNGLAFPRLDCLASLQSLTGVTTTTVVGTTSTTSSTLPGCVRAATFASLTCRLTALGEAIDGAAVELGSLHAKLAPRALAARAKLAEAEAAVAEADRKGARRALRAATKKVCAVARRLGSRRARRLVPDATRAPLVEAAAAACEDLHPLRAAL